MNEITQKNIDFTSIYSKSHRLATAVFMVSGVMDRDDELRSKMKSLSLRLVSISVNIKDSHFLDAKKLTTDLEKNSLELMSLLDIAAISGLISKMNGNILKTEFQTFILELGKFTEKFENNKNVSVESVFAESISLGLGGFAERLGTGSVDAGGGIYKNTQNSMLGNSKTKENGNGNGQKRKDFRKHAVLEFIKGHNMVSIKDIMPNINGCSEKTIQRELISLIDEGKVKKVGERRWSRYSVA